ncbi:PREDICTED: uclacyanin-2-like [Camelina sativa]|uniref:Uclacyanin-2-like n=1 Tax=Camelina sativa TaxID=90675 RepID=A0ABM0YZC5_CAMSA|nr:PREDICTED: uclacyanin-2-like [Camelina sativa]
MAMNGLAKMAAIALLMVMAIVPAAVAVTHTVGGASQWASGVDYTVWATGKTFRVGDTLKFTYGPSHSVNEVNKAGYDSCGGTPIDTHSGGDTEIDLETVGIKYFICPTSGHCEGGMKLAVTVVAASTGPPATPSPPSSTPETPTKPGSPPADGTPPTTPTPDSGSTSPPPPKPSGASKGVMSYVLVGVSMVLGYGLWM